MIYFVQRLNGTIDWQPIPVHTVAIEHENVSDIEHVNILCT